jgi:hypothetical protein
MGNGWENSTFIRVIVIEGVPYSGIFFYSPTLGTGNLVGSWTSQAGTDPYGNPYPAGLALYDGSGDLIGNWNTSGLTIQAQPNSGGALSIGAAGTSGASPALELTSGLAPAGTNPLFIQVLNALITAGMDTLLITGPQSPLSTDAHESYVYAALTQGAGDYGALLQLAFWEVTDGAHNYLEISKTGAALIGSVTGTVPGSLPATAETWHSLAALPYQNAWTDFGAGHQDGRYQIDATGRVWLDGDLAPGTYTNGTTIFTMPADYRPVAVRTYTRQTEGNGGGTLGISVFPTGGVIIDNIVSTAGVLVDLSGISWPTT